MAGNSNVVISERDALIKVASLAGYWAYFSGSEKSVTATEVWNGGSDTPDVISGKPTLSNIIIRRPFKPSRDLDMGRNLRRQVGSRIDTISCQYTDSNGQTVGKPRVDSGCLLIRVKFPDYDVNSNNAAMIELEYKPQKES